MNIVDTISQNPTIQEMHKHPILGICHDILLTIVCSLVLVTGAVYAYETIRPANSYIEISSLKSTKSLRVQTDTVKFHTIATVGDLSSANLETILRCDSGEGFVVVSTSITDMNDSTTVDPVLLDQIELQLSAVKETVVYTSITPATQILTNNKTPAALHTVEVINAPAVSSACFLESTIVVNTPVFNIPKSTKFTSYPFGYR